MFFSVIQTSSLPVSLLSFTGDLREYTVHVSIRLQDVRDVSVSVSSSLFLFFYSDTSTMSASRTAGGNINPSRRGVERFLLFFIIEDTAAR